MIERPLKPQWFQILLALSTQDRHGYGIQRAVLEQTEGHMRL
jgi:DNA-binding PadR family transcriptional regulator